MKKASSAAMVLSRSCPLCFTRVDPVWYGWHISKCNSVNSKAANIAPKSTREDAQNCHFDASVCEEIPAVLPSSCTTSLPLKSSLVGDNGIVAIPDGSQEVSELVHLRLEKQTLADKVRDLELQLEEVRHQFSMEKQSWADKLRCLELNVKDLECQSRKVEEHERDADRLREPLQGSAGEENRQHQKEAGHSNRLLDIVASGTRNLSSDKQSNEIENGLIFGGDQGNDGKELYEHSDHVEARAQKNIMTTSTDTCELDRVVDLACTKEPLAKDFLSKVDQHLAESQRSASLKRNCDTMQESSYPDIQAKIDPQVSSEKYNGHLATCSNQSPSTNVLDQEQNEAPGVSLHLSNQEGAFNSFWEDVLDAGDPSGNKSQEDKFGVKKPNGSLVTQKDYCGPHLDTQGAHVEGQCEILDAKKSIDGLPEILCKDQSHAEKACSRSVSSSSESSFHVVRVKTGTRRLVLSDSESEGDICQETPTEIQTHVCGTKESNFLPSAHLTRLTDGVTLKEDCGNGRVSQPSFQRARRWSLVEQLSDDVALNDEGGQCSQRIAEGLKASVTNLEEATMEASDDRESSRLRRSKRLRTLKPHIKDLDHCRVISHSSSSETSSSVHGFKESKSKVSLHSYGYVPRNISRKQREKKLRQHVQVTSSSSTETSSGDEGLRCKRSKRSSRVCKRLFTDAESKPAYGDNQLNCGETDESESESADSLKDFLTDSEDVLEGSESCSDEMSLSESQSSRDAYHNPRLRREINVRHYVWELEPEMLSAFAINMELCLRAVCAINRRQTEDEQTEKTSKYVNKRGFNMLYAKRGTRIAEFLTDGDPKGPVKKSAEDLKKFDPGGLEFCKMIATLHSKQLFDIYKNAEDLHFPFS